MNDALSRAQACIANGEVEQALAMLEPAVRAEKDNASLHAGLGVALRFAGRIGDAAGAFARALELQPGRADAALYLGMIRLAQGRQQEGWPLYRARWRNASWTEKLRYPGDALWQGRVHRGMRLLLWGEQGFGDVIQFARYAPWLQRRLQGEGASLALEVPAPLLALMRASWPEMEIFASGETRGRFDAHLPLLDLPNLFGNEIGDGGLPWLPLPLPYLAATPDARAAQRGAVFVAGRQDREPLRVGIAWQGRTSHPDDRWRSIAARELEPLFAVPGIRWISLQKAMDDALERPSGLPDDLAHCRDFADTAQVADTLDLVVCTDSAVAHLAGALGKPVWLLLPRIVDWRWGLAGEDTPWYLTFRLFRQGADADWSAVIACVAGELGLLSRHAGTDIARKRNTTEEASMINPEESSSAAAGAAHPQLEITTSRQMLAWMAEQKLSLALTTYQIGKLFLLGLKPNGELSVFERTFNRCMGMCPTSNGFYMTSLYQVWRFENVFTNGEQQDGYDRLYVPQLGNTTGDLDIHDMIVEDDGRLVFVNTLFGCLATLSDTHSFRPLWQPPFARKLAAEDRCHLNGLATRDGHAAYVTAVSESDVVDGWRDHRADGGIVIDVRTNEIVCRGLSMPHSPRWHQGKLWLCNSGTGDFGHVDVKTGRFEPVTFCAGYMRGLYFHGDYALVGLSKPRHNKTFSGLPLDENLKARKAEARCGLQVIDLRTGDAVHWLRIEGIVEELYDVITLPGVRQPMALGFKTDEIRRVISIDEAAKL